MSENKDQVIQFYVRAADYEDIKKLSKRTGLSISKLAWMAYSRGYKEVKNMMLKWEHEKGKSANAEIK
jgi:hypothetical protein